MYIDYFCSILIFLLIWYLHYILLVLCNLVNNIVTLVSFFNVINSSPSPIYFSKLLWNCWKGMNRCVLTCPYKTSCPYWAFGSYFSCNWLTGLAEETLICFFLFLFVLFWFVWGFFTMISSWITLYLKLGLEVT